MDLLSLVFFRLTGASLTLGGKVRDWPILAKRGCVLVWEQEWENTIFAL
ncbi:hypothetical protein KFU94_09760 [Chloroflexi bacterium TSY]|nr:hypothetical protein [Chloroflexi bacterium TSY]